MRFYWNGGYPWAEIGPYEVWLRPLHFAWPSAEGAGMDIWGPCCFTCGKLTFGCKSHWFCGLCEKCREECEENE